MDIDVITKYYFCINVFMIFKSESLLKADLNSKFRDGGGGPGGTNGTLKG